MKHLFRISFALAFLAGCGSQEPEIEGISPDEAAEYAPTEETAEPGPPRGMTGPGDRPAGYPAPINQETDAEATEEGDAPAEEPPAEEPPAEEGDAPAEEEPPAN